MRSSAWAVPAVVVAAPLQAFAASTSGSLTFNTLNGYGASYVSGKPTMLESQVMVRNVYSATSPTLSTITVTVSLPDTRVSGGTATTTGSGWTSAAPTHTGGFWVYTFVYTGSVTPTAPNNSTSTLTYRVPLIANMAGNFTVSATATATGVTSASSSATTHDTNA